MRKRNWGGFVGELIPWNDAEEQLEESLSVKASYVGTGFGNLYGEENLQNPSSRACEKIEPKSAASARKPYVGTGFGNLYGE